MKTFIVVLAAIALQGGSLVEGKRFDARKVSDLDIFGPLPRCQLAYLRSKTYS